MDSLDAGFLRRIVAAAPEGIVLCDARKADFPVTYVNAAFEQMTGYAAAELTGSNLRCLQGADRDQDGRRRLREAISRQEECRVLLRNYRKNGELLWNEMFLQPLRDDAGLLTHYVGFHRDAGSLLRSSSRGPEGLPSWLREDRVSGVSSRPWFEELLLREWHQARRESRHLTLMLFDIDSLALYNDTFGRAGGDACLRRVARTIAGVFRRATDVVGRWDAGCIAVLTVHRDATGIEPVLRHAESTVERITQLRIHHPRSPALKFVTVTAGAATCMPERDEDEPTRLIEAARAALADGKRDRRGALTS
jgi:diguanylate cyclase (GGDEF)-like protein/PAS domain S-box-containing protein